MFVKIYKQIKKTINEAFVSVVVERSIDSWGSRFFIIGCTAQNNYKNMCYYTS